MFNESVGQRECYKIEQMKGLYIFWKKMLKPQAVFLKFAFL
jgi:hypothetical protein